MGGISIPEQFTFPFFYEPHPLSELAAKELQNRIENEIQWHHNFGLDDNEVDKGKMFGVLVVHNKAGQWGYLSAYSGKLTGLERPKGFVPPVYNLPQGDNFFEQGMRGINRIDVEFNELRNSEMYQLRLACLNKAKAESIQELAEFKFANLKAKKERKGQRDEAERLPVSERGILEESLVKQSLQQKYRLRVLKQSWKQALEFLQS